MHIITVIPLKRKVPFAELTYFYHSPLSVGAIVEIPFQKKEILAIVITTCPLASMKAEIKGKPYSLKKIKNVLYEESPFWSALIDSARITSKRTLTSLSRLVEYTTNDHIRDQKPTLFVPGEKLGKSFQIQILLGSREERTDKIKRLVRECFAKKESIVIIAPTMKAVEVLYEKIKTGIQPSTFLLHSGLKNKEQKDTYKEILSRKAPFVLITTPHFALLPSVLLWHMVIEDESHFLYERTPAGELPIRDFFIEFAKRSGISLTLSDGIPRFESIWNYAPTLRIPRDYCPDSLVFLEKEKTLDMIEPYIKKIVKVCIRDNKSLFLYTNRKGFAPLSRCDDCGTEITCTACNLPMTLRIKHGKDRTQKREFCCLSCGEILPPGQICRECGSWNIKMNAIGTEGFYSALSEYVGDTIPVYMIDDRATPDSKEIIELTEVLKKKKSYILIGTEKALPYLPQVDYSIVPVYDRILSTPGTRITEGLLRLLYTLQEKTNQYVYIGTKDTSMFTQALREKNIQKIIEEEYALRKSLLYPPFGHLLVIECEVSASHLEKTQALLESLFADVEHTIPPAKIIDAASMRTEIRMIAQVSDDFIDEQGRYIIDVLQNHKILHRIILDPERINFL
jgi:primosomal protein N'